MADLVVTNGVRIPETAITFETSRSSGPGGQNVNKVSSKVALRVEVDQIVGLTIGARGRLQELAGNRWLDGGILLITASETRSQLENRALAESKLVALIQQAIVIPRARRETKPTRGSQERRVEGKKQRSQVKRNRGNLRPE